MPASNHHNSSSHLGRFIVKSEDVTHTDLTADQVLELLDDPRSEGLNIFRIHRVCENGEMELVGVAAATFKQRDCLLFTRAQITDARRDYDAIVDLGRNNPPPCRVEVQFGHVQGFSLPHVVVLIFPAACSHAMGQWLTCADYMAGDDVTGSPSVLTAYLAASPQVVKQHIIETAIIQ